MFRSVSARVSMPEMISVTEAQKSLRCSRGRAGGRFIGRLSGITGARREAELKPLTISHIAKTSKGGRMLEKKVRPLPEPMVSVEPAGDPEQQALLADSVSLALLVVLENLTPAERLAFVLHDMFDVPFDEIAPIVGRTAAATRQLASRARRRVRGLAPSPNSNIARQREVVDAFLAASRAGDFEALVSVLDPDVVFRIDSGEIGTEGRPQILGAPAVAERLLARGARFAPHAKSAIVNGTAGLIVPGDVGLRAVVGFTVAGGKVTAIDLITDREKLRRLRLA